MSNPESHDTEPFHKVFPIMLKLPDTTCYFQCKDHLDKYVKRYKIKKPNVSKTTPRKGETKGDTKKTRRNRGSS